MQWPTSLTAGQPSAAQSNQVSHDASWLAWDVQRFQFEVEAFRLELDIASAMEAFACPPDQMPAPSPDAAD
jgi:outer membrane murein-binding lipoprotein Lpp